MMSLAGPIQIPEFLEPLIDYRYSLEPPRQGGSNEYHNLCFEQKYEKYQFLSENFQFVEVKFSIYLNRRVFIMDIFLTSAQKHMLQHSLEALH